MVLEKNDLTSRGMPNTIMADSFPGCGRQSCRPVCLITIQDTESFCLFQYHLHYASNAVIAKKRNGIGSDPFYVPDPSIAKGAFAEEIKYLTSLGYHFVKDGWVWKAVL